MADFYTVSQINGYIKGMFERDFVLKRIRVKGEVSNCKYHGSGHIYFTLKDSEAQINCVMFRSSRDGLTFIMKDGQQIEATGQISVYEKGGSYQLYVRTAALSGAGELYEKYLELKNKLEWLLRDKEAVEKYKCEAADFICSKYNWDDTVEQTLMVYR